jgi:uncharacterized protein
MAKLPEEIKPAFQGMFPSILGTCSKDGTPNVTVISQVYYVDPEHVALSFQFFNKTIKNVRENPRAAVQVIEPSNLGIWRLEVRFSHSETDGPLFDAMDMQLEAIASMTGMSGIFKLKAADVYHVEDVRKVS